MCSAFFNKQKFFFYSIFTCLFFLKCPVNAAPVSEELTVNDYHPGHQVLTATATAGNGNKIILWSDDTRGQACFVQIFDNNGIRQFTTERLTGFKCLDVAADRIGNFIITTNESDGSGRGVYFRMYDRFGNALANPIRVNDVTASDQFGGKIAIGSDGRFVISWARWNSANKIDLFFKIYNSSGQALTSSALVANSSPNQSIDAFLFQPNGDMVLTFSAAINNDFDVWMRRYSSAGFPAGSAVKVNSYTSSIQVSSKLAASVQGKMLVTWESYRQDGDGWSCYAQLFNSLGAKLGSAARLTTELSSYQPSCEIGMASDGNFAVTWQQSYTQPEYKVDLRIREFDENALPISSETNISAKAGDYLSFPKIAMDLVGNYSVAWRSYNATTGYQVTAQRFLLANRPVITSINNNTVLNNLQGETGTWIYYKINIPADTSTLVVNLVGGGVGNADLYLNYGALPTLNMSDIKLTRPDSSEAVSITTPPPGDMYIGIYATDRFSGTQLNAYFY
jgi:serine protease